jgi:hypothetical protein
MVVDTYRGTIYTYYFATDNGDPSSLHSLKVMRVCHYINALYELTLVNVCGGRTPDSNSRISGVSVVDSFAGILIIRYQALKM